MDKPYSSKRWHDVPKAVDSLCNSCKNWIGFGKCKKHKDKVPKDILEQSFPSTEKFKEDYCEYRELK